MIMINHFLVIDPIYTITWLEFQKHSLKILIGLGNKQLPWKMVIQESVFKGRFSPFNLIISMFQKPRGTILLLTYFGKSFYIAILDLSNKESLFIV